MYFMYSNLNTCVFKDYVCLISVCAKSNVCTFELEKLEKSNEFGQTLNTWGSRLTWTAQRQHAAQIIGSMEAFLAGDFSHSVQNPRGIGVNGPV